jgi:hypothetical protein
MRQPQAGAIQPVQVALRSADVAHQQPGMSRCGNPYTRELRSTAWAGSCVSAMLCLSKIKLVMSAVLQTPGSDDGGVLVTRTQQRLLRSLRVIKRKTLSGAL